MCGQRSTFSSISSATAVASLFLSALRGATGVDPATAVRVTAAGILQHEKGHLRPDEELIEQEAVATSTIAPAQPGEILWDGSVQVSRPAVTMSQVIQLEAESEECMETTPVSICWQKFGSYGIRRMVTMEWDSIDMFNLARPDWMGHKNVQKMNLYDLTLPATHHSGAYMVHEDYQASVGRGPYGVLTQNLNITEQLKLGIRAFDLRVACTPEANTLYISHRYLTVPFMSVLDDISRFMKEHPKEIIFIMAKMDKDAPANSSIAESGKGHTNPIIREESDANRIPGELVHEKVYEVLGKHLMLHDALAKLKGDTNETVDNPKISTLVQHDLRVLYFWEGQQVLCVTLEACQNTPGWSKAAPADPVKYAFGAPTSSLANGQVVQPACMLSFEDDSTSNKPDQTAKNVKKFVYELREKYAQAHRPPCLAADATVADVHTPSLMYSADAYYVPEEPERSAQMQLLRSAKAVFSRGEGFSIRAEAERVNYLLLSWLFKEGYQSVFTQPNIVSMDYPAPILVHRIIEAMQGQKDCGWVIYCKVTGGCWAASLLKPDTGKCLGEEDAMYWVSGMAEGSSLNPWLVATGVIAMVWILAYACRFAMAMGDPSSKGSSWTAMDCLCPFVGLFATPSSHVARSPAQASSAAAPAASQQAAVPATSAEPASAEPAAAAAPAPAPAVEEDTTIASAVEPSPTTDSAAAAESNTDF